MTSITLRACAVSLLIAFVPLFSPWAGAQGVPTPASSARPASVGTFDVVPHADGGAGGVARGAVVSSLVGGSDASAVIRDLAVASAGAQLSATVFSAVHVEGFEPASQLRGVGTSSLEVVGKGFLVSLHDSASSLLIVRAQASAERARWVTFTTPEGLAFTKDALLDGVLRVSGGAEGGVRGALVLVGNDGSAASAAGSRLVLSHAREAKVLLEPGTQVLFRAEAAYGASARAARDVSVAAYDEAVVTAMARGALAGEATSDFSEGANLLVQASAFLGAQARTSASAAQRVTTLLKTHAAASGSACGAADARATTGSAVGEAGANACARATLLAYDLDYVNVPARAAENVAVYVDGALAQRVEAATDVATRASAYWSTTVDGRVLVLVNAAAHARAATEVTIAAVADARSAAATLARLDAEQEVTSEVEGGFELLAALATEASGTGSVIGTFTSFAASEARGEAAVRDVTDVRSATRIFERMEFAADAAADASARFAYATRDHAAAQGRASARATSSVVVEMTTSVAGETRAVTRFSDSAFAIIETQARASTLVDLRLDQQIGVSALSGVEGVLRLDGPAGRVGHLILARAEGGAASSSAFDVSHDGHVRVLLQKGESLVFRAASDARSRANADLAARAIHEGALGVEAAVGFVGNVVTSTHVDHKPHVRLAFDAAAEATRRGVVTFEVATEAAWRAQTTAVSLVADRATLAARDAADIAVTVDGRAAATASTAADALAQAASTGQATAYVAAGLAGQTQAFLALPAVEPGDVIRVVVSSLLDARSRLDAALDVFGSFHPAYGGVAQGDIVRLVARPEAGLLLAYTVAARSEAEAKEGSLTTVFDAVKLGSGAFAFAGAPSPTALRFESEEGAIEVFDVSTGVMKLAASAQTTARLDLAQAVTARVVSPGVLFLDAPDLSAALILVEGSAGARTSSIAHAEGVVTAHLAAGAQLIFKAFSGFESQLSDAQRRAQAEAIARGEIVGHIIVRTDPVTRVTSSTAVNYAPAIAAGAVVGSEVGGAGGARAGYAAVQAITQVASAEKVELVVTSATSAGKSIVVSLDRHTLRGLLSGEAGLFVDGKRVREAKSYEDALDATEDKYHVLTAGAEVGLQAIVALGHFSTRTITLESPPSPSIFLWTTIALAVVVVGQAIVPVLRKRAR